MFVAWEMRTSRSKASSAPIHTRRENVKLHAIATRIVERISSTP